MVVSAVAAIALSATLLISVPATRDRELSSAATTTTTTVSRSPIPPTTQQPAAPTASAAGSAAAAAGIDLSWQSVTPDLGDTFESRVVGRIEPTGPGGFVHAGAITVLPSPAEAQTNTESLGRELASTLNAGGFATWTSWWACGSIAYAYSVGYTPPLTEEQARQQADTAIRAMQQAFAGKGWC